MLESLDQSNIKRMSVEGNEARRELLFDPAKEITETDWRDFEVYLKQRWKKNGQRIAIVMVSEAKTLGHDYTNVLNTMSREEIKRLIDSFNSGTKSWTETAELVHAARNLFPDMELQPIDLDRMKFKVAENMKANSFSIALQIAEGAEAYKPGSRLLTKEDFDKIKAQISGKNFRHGRLLARMKGLDPSFNLDQFKIDMPTMVLEARKASGQDNVEYVRTASLLNRLNPDLTQRLESIEPIPEQRNF